MQYLTAFAIGTALLIITPVAAVVAIANSRIPQGPPGIPWADLRGKWFFPKLRAVLRSVAAGRKPIEEGYKKYTKHGKAFVLPGIHWVDVVLPPSYAHWVISQPEHVMSIGTAQDHVMALEYLPHGSSLADTHDFTVIRRDLTRQMGNVLPVFVEELGRTTDSKIGGEPGEEFREVLITKALEHTVRRAMKRIFVGLPYCRDEAWLSYVDWYEFTFGVSGLIVLFVIPISVKRIFAPIVAIPFRIIQWIVLKPLVSEVQNRLAAEQKRSVSEKYDISAPSERNNDALQWVLEMAASKIGWSNIQPRAIASKTILFNFFAMHTTTTTALETLIEILCYSSSAELMTQLREEAESILPLVNENPQAVRQMTKLDSVIREVLRWNPMFGHSLMREVIVPGGITTPDGLYLPKGTHVSCAVTTMQRDTDIQGEGWDEFQPLRFHDAAVEKDKRQDMAIQVDEKYLSFGLGRHACPGRFFAVQSLKLILGYLLVHYDFEPFTERPKMLEINDSVVPGQKLKVKLRRRKESIAAV